ncbi:sensor histidine kinase [Arthrobacter sp. Soil762]|uniref:sensor histidine kinase n=1 Tax=Arthrobacter sp. Soil762 TaxID=1736401 RepID=UPI0006F5E975|nr:ATP-binding protein [Arthrobacter sp. Soil762]KRE76238.1 histidine kinase [Arthrobacter sp. Soil762]
MSQTATLDKRTAGAVITEDLTADFHALGLAGCIDKLTVPLRHQGVCVRWETPHHGVEIPATCANLLYHAAQETLTNAFRHSHATELTVRLAAVDHGVRLTITDNGVGFNYNSQSTSRKRGYGVCLMTMAVHEAAGTISIDSAPDKGTQVAITIPLD